MLTVSQLDADGIAVGVIHEYESLEWTESLGASGASMVCDADLAAILATGGLHIADGDHEWTCHAASDTSDAAMRGQVTFDSDLTWLAKIQPHPSPIDLDEATQSHDVIAGPANVALATLIDRNAGAAAHATRQRDWTVVASTLAAPDTTIRARWTPSLLDWVARKGVPNGVAVSVVRDTSDGGATVTCRTGAELDLVFTEASAVSWTRSSKAPTVTHLWAGGAGEGTARLIRYAELPDGPRVEGFLSRPNVSVAAELDQELAEALYAGRRSVSLEVELGVAASVVYGRDFLLGDIVNVWVGDLELSEPVTSVRSRVTSSGVERTIKVGFGPTDPRASGRLEARRAAARLDDIEGEA